jgi:hypothetical protein
MRSLLLLQIWAAALRLAPANHPGERWSVVEP